jgi:nicotinic acetylcholine receptor
MSRPGDKITLKTMAATAKMRDQIREIELKERSSRSLLANVLDMDDDFRPATLRTPHSTPGWRIGGSHEDPIAATVSHHPCLGAHRELSLILKELRMITDKIRKDDEAADITNEWKFAAMVVDRLCLIVFTLFTIIATVAVLASAPQPLLS